MKFAFRIVAIGLVLVGISSEALAQRGRSNSGVLPGNPAYNFTSSLEWRQAGGHYGIYLQLMEQKAMAAQQKASLAEAKELQKQYQAALKQQAAFDKWVKDQTAKKEKGKTVDPVFQQMLDEQARYKLAEEARLARIAAKKSKAKKKNAVKTKAEPPIEEKPKEPMN